MQQHGVKSLQCDVCQFKIRKKGSRETLRRMMDQHIIANHYSSIEANEIKRGNRNNTGNRWRNKTFLVAK